MERLRMHKKYPITGETKEKIRKRNNHKTRKYFFLLDIMTLL